VTRPWSCSDLHCLWVGHAGAASAAADGASLAGMTDLLDQVLGAHGGLERWNRARALTAHLDFGGPFWAARGWDQVLRHQTVRIDTTREHLTTGPFTTPGRSIAYDVAPDGADRIALLGPDGSELETRSDPRTTFPPYDASVGWDALQVAYFTAVATWNYLMEPFLFALPDVETREVDPWTEGGETWRRLAVTFPERLPNHNREQTFYFGEDFLMRRMDYHPDVTASPIAHYVAEPTAYDGLVFYARRLVHPRRPDNTAVTDLAVITIDTESVEVR
jgi:hypothetical protein